jgi:hypothetical protein
MAAPKDERIAVPIDDPNADTEWYLLLFPHLILTNPLPGTTSSANTA